ncbi:MAG: hypothetical protein JWQ71_5060 [Pedosphaera sp.]|nr:hypothetical protein [Pedosphaera sp.]
MKIEPFDSKKIEKLFEEVRKFYKDVEKNADKASPGEINGYLKTINEYSRELVMLVAREGEAYQKKIDAEIREELKKLEQDLQAQKKQHTGVIDDYVKERSALGQQGVKLYEALKKKQG